MNPVRTCEQCGLDNPDARDFCSSCGGYLRWELTGQVPLNQHAGRSPQPVSAPQATAVQVVASEQASVTLRVPGTELGPADDVEVATAAGGEVVVFATVHNRHEMVKRFAVRVEGLPDSWWTVTPEVVHLLPPGSGEGYEAEVEVRLHPPRTPAAEARRWAFWIEAVPVGATDSQARSRMAGLTIDAYRECVTALHPMRRAGRRGARYGLRVHNRGNATAAIVPDARDDTGDCRCRCEPTRLSLAPGEEADVAVIVKPPRPLLLGRPIDRALQVDGIVDDVAVLPTLPGVYRQRAWLPRWLLLLIPLLLAVLALAWLRAPNATVPQLTGLPGRFEAQKRLDAAGLRLDPTPSTRVTTDTAPGTVVDQIPRAGKRVHERDAVTIVVAVAPDTAPVPDITHMTLAQADRELGDEFHLGSVTPVGASSTATIVTQRPAAGDVRRLGTPIEVTLRRRNGSHPIVGPVSPTPTASPSPSPFGDARLVAAGAGGLRLAAPGGTAVVRGTRGARQPAWSADGSTIAFARAGRIWAVRADDGPGAPAPLSDSRGDYEQPAYSPDGATLAFVDAKRGSVCVASASGAPDASTCLEDPTWRFSDVAFGPTGHALALAATARKAGGPGGMVEYIAAGDPAIGASWKPAPSGGGLVLQLPSVPQVAWAEDRLAVLEGAPGTVTVLPAKGDAITPTGSRIAGLTACSIAWSPDGRLAVADTCGRAGALTLVDSETQDRVEVGHGSDPALTTGADGG